MKYSTRIKKSANQRGLALMFSLGILAVLTVIVLIYASRAGIERNVANAMFQGQQAQNMAESAFSRAVLHLCGEDNIKNPFYCSVGSTAESANPTLSKEEREELISHQSEAEIFDDTAAPQWIYIHEDANDNSSPIIGRIAYAGAQYARVCGNPLCCGHYLFCDYNASYNYNSNDDFVNHIKDCTYRNCWSMVHQEWDPAFFPIMYSDGSVKNFDHDTFVEKYVKNVKMYADSSKDLAGSGFLTMEAFMSGMGIPYKVGNYSNYDILSRFFDFSKRERPNERDCWYAGGELYKAGDYHMGEKLSGTDHHIGHKKRDRYFHRFSLKRYPSSWISNKWYKAYIVDNNRGDSGYEDAWDQVTVRRIVESKPAHVFDDTADSAVKRIFLTGVNAYTNNHDQTMSISYPYRYVIGGGTDTNGTSYQFANDYNGYVSRVGWKDGRPYKADQTVNAGFLAADEDVINDTSYPTFSSQDGYYPNQDAWNDMCIPYFKNWADSAGGWDERGANAVADKRNQIVANFIWMGKEYTKINGAAIKSDSPVTDIPSSCWGLNPVYGSTPTKGTMPYDDTSSTDTANKLCVDAHGKKSVEPTYVSVMNNQRMLNEVAVKMKGGYLGYDSLEKKTNSEGKVTHYIYHGLQMYVQFHFDVETVRMNGASSSGEEESSSSGQYGQLARICGSGKFNFKKFYVDGTTTKQRPETYACTILKDNANFLMGKEITCSDTSKRYLDFADGSGVRFLRPDSRYGDNWVQHETVGGTMYEKVNFQTTPQTASGGNTDYEKSMDSTTKLLPYASSFVNVMLMIPIGDVVVAKTSSEGDLSEFYDKFNPLEITDLEMSLAVVETNGATGSELYNRGGYDYAKMPTPDSGKGIKGVSYTIQKGANGKGETQLLADWQVDDPRHNGLMNQWTKCASETVISKNSTVTLGGGTDQDAELATDPAYLGKAKDKHLSTAGASGFSNLAAVGKVHRAAPWQTLNFHKPTGTVPSAWQKVDTDMLAVGGGAYSQGDFLLLDQLNFVDRKQNYRIADKTVYSSANVAFIDLNMPDNENRDFAFELLFRGNYWLDDDGNKNMITDAQAKTLAGWLAAGCNKMLYRRTGLFCSPGGEFWNFFTKSPANGTLETDVAQENLLCRTIALTKAEKPWDIYRIYVIGQAIKDVGGDGKAIPVSRRDDKSGKVTTVNAQLGKFEEGADLIEGECKLSVEMFYFQKYEQWKILKVNYETE